MTASLVKPSNTPPQVSRLERSLLALTVVCLLVIGTSVRLSPLVSEARTIAAISEDGYLMLTVARNLALGRSLSIAEGTIRTNGVQPLVTFVWAGLHGIVGSERLPALRAVIVVQFVVAIATALFVALLAREAFRDHPWRDVAGMLAGSLWFASPLALRHTSNGLETGLYVGAIAAFLLIDLRWRGRSVIRAVSLGFLLGLLFLIRNDAIFLIFAFLLAELIGRRPLGALLTAGAALAAACPWLLYNALVFGHVVPVSGRAQNLNSGLGENLVALPRVLAEYGSVAFLLPDWLSANIWWALVTTFSLLLVLTLTLQRAHRVGMRLERWMALLFAHVTLLTAYYGLFFGAAYFLSRYLFPLSLLAVLVPAIWIVPRLGGGGTRYGLPGLLVAVALTLATGVMAARLYSRSATHDHMQVVEWVSSHLPPNTWVGAPQSGTLGYFHDRTINLDGKVNPEALEARRQNRLFHYIVEDTRIEYIADWYGLARWVDRPETVYEEHDGGLLARHFRVVVRDPAHNLIVLRRLQDPPSRVGLFTF